MIGTDDGFETDVTGFREQDRTETHGQVRHPRGPFTNVGEFVGEACARMDFQQELGQVDSWQQRPHLITQGEATGRFVQLVQAGEYQRVTVCDAFHAHRVIR